MTSYDFQGPSPAPTETGANHQAPIGDGSHSPICAVGPGWKFTSGISYYTCRLANSVADNQQEISVILLRHLLPRCLYPGRRRVGLSHSNMNYRDNIPVYDGIDWFWGMSLVRALKFLRDRRPKVLLLQWWTAATLHTFLMLTLVGRILGARVVLEVHEIQDPGEAGLAAARRYGEWGLRTLLRLAHGCIVHSKSDLQMLEKGYGPLKVRVALAAHGPYDQYIDVTENSNGANGDTLAAVRKAPKPGSVNILFFGLIRPYKGLEDLLQVFNSLPREEAERLWLTVVGETWEGCTEPAHLIASSPHADRITFVNEYVPDSVVAAAFAHADIAVLPYRRSSSSGILHIAMSWGIPVVVTNVGGLLEAASGYEGAVFIPPGDSVALREGIMRSVQLVGHKFADPRDWRDNVAAIMLAGADPAHQP